MRATRAALLRPEISHGHCGSPGFHYVYMFRLAKNMCAGYDGGGGGQGLMRDFVDG
jgi:hypothetical protein